MRHLSPGLLVAALALGLGSFASIPTIASDAPWRHGASLMGPLKYPSDFKHFDYVNPNAPRGGVVRFGETGTFDTFNLAIPKGNMASGIGLLYDTLMSSALDEISSAYGEIAEALRYPEDFSSVTYRLRPEARWHDGKPLTAEDVVWSFKKLVELSPQQSFYYRHVKSVEITGEREVTFTFDETGNRELPSIVGQLIILPKHWWEGIGPDGKQRDISQTSLEPPLGSGPYRLKSFEAGRTLIYEKVENYWGDMLPVNIGQNNFAEIYYEFYRDEQVELEAFKGDKYDMRSENTAKNWATAYDFPARSDGRVILETFDARGSGVGVGFIFNLRRAKFQDVRLRAALNYVLPFEEMNRTTFFGQYQRIGSYFHGTDLAAKDLPEGRELELLNEAKAKGPVPDEVFTSVYANPVAADTGGERANLREALRLLREAGYVTQGARLVDGKTKEPLTLEFLMNGPTFERVAVRFREQLAKLGIDLVVRSVDSSQYVNRVRSWDYDLIYSGWGQSLSPGNEQTEYFGSASADRQGSRNFAGIKNPAIDYLIGQIVFARSREDLEAATRALDRVLLWNHYMVPGWTIKQTRMARWNRFSRPQILPYYAEPAFPNVWWWDASKAAQTGASR